MENGQQSHACTHNAAPGNAEGLFRELRDENNEASFRQDGAAYLFFQCLFLPSSFHQQPFHCGCRGGAHTNSESEASCGELCRRQAPRSENSHEESRAAPMLTFLKSPPPHKQVSTEQKGNGTSSCCSYHNPSTQRVFAGIISQDYTALFQLTLLSTIELSVKEKQALQKLSHSGFKFQKQCLLALTKYVAESE